MISFPISSWALASGTGSKLAYLDDILQSDNADGPLLPARLGGDQQDVAATGLEADVSLRRGFRPTSSSLRVSFAGPPMLSLPSTSDRSGGHWGSLWFTNVETGFGSLTSYPTSARMSMTPLVRQLGHRAEVDEHKVAWPRRVIHGDSSVALAENLMSA